MRRLGKFALTVGFALQVVGFGVALLAVAGTLASGIAGDTDALPIRTSARVLGATLKAGQQAEYRLASGRHAYLVPAAGKVEVNGVTARTGDGLAIQDEAVLHISAGEDAELVLVDTV